MPHDAQDVQSLHKKAVNRFNELHASIFGSISSMLKVAKLQPLRTLKEHNPSFVFMVSELEHYKVIAVQVSTLLDIDTRADIAMIDEYLVLARGMANAIDTDDPEALCEAIAALDDKPYI